MIKTLEGLVITSTDYKENDVIIKVLLEDDRFKSLILKGAKKISSHKREVVMPYSLCELTFDDNPNSPVAYLKSAHLKETYFSTSDIFQNATLSLIAELAWRIEERDIVSFELVKICFSKAMTNPLLAVTFYIGRLLKSLGLSPMVDHCALCKRHEVIAIGIKEGGFLCQEHAGFGKILSIERLKKFRLINKCPLDKIDVLEDYGFDYFDFELEAEFFFYHYDLKLKAYDFFKSLFKQY